MLMGNRNSRDLGIRFVLIFFVNSADFGPVITLVENLEPKIVVVATIGVGYFDELS